MGTLYEENRLAFRNQTSLRDHKRRGKRMEWTRNNEAPYQRPATKKIRCNDILLENTDFPSPLMISSTLELRH
jgi:hypothetical protein